MSHYIANTHQRAQLLGDDSDELEVRVCVARWKVEIPFECGSWRGVETYDDAELTEITHKGKPLPFELEPEELRQLLEDEIRRIAKTAGSY